MEISYGNEIATAFWKPFPDSVIDDLVKKADIFTCAGGFVIEDPLLAPYLDRTDGAMDRLLLRWVLVHGVLACGPYGPVWARMGR